MAKRNEPKHEHKPSGVLTLSGYNMKHLQCHPVFTHIYQKIEDSGVQGLGERVPGVTGLLHIEGHVDGLRLASPFAVHLPAR